MQVGFKIAYQRIVRFTTEYSLRVDDAVWVHPLSQSNCLIRVERRCNALTNQIAFKNRYKNAFDSRVNDTSGLKFVISLYQWMQNNFIFISLFYFALNVILTNLIISFLIDYAPIRIDKDMYRYALIHVKIHL